MCFCFFGNSRVSGMTAQRVNVLCSYLSTLYLATRDRLFSVCSQVIIILFQKPEFFLLVLKKGLSVFIIRISRWFRIIILLLTHGQLENLPFFLFFLKNCESKQIERKVVRSFKKCLLNVYFN